MKSSHLQRCLLPCLLSATGSLLPVVSYAQTNIVPATDGTGTVVTSQENQFDISGGSLSANGQNLFHSFEKLGLDANQIANFLATPNLQNILGRVVGGETSIINGLIQVTGGNPNLYLMNPAGFIFGQNATLNVPGDFFVTTATGIGFEEGWFNSSGDSPYQALGGTPNQFVFLEGGTILNQGKLALDPGQILTLAGNQVNNQGTLSTPGGTITLTAVEEGRTLRISQEGMLLSLEINPDHLDPDGFSPLDLSTLLTGAAKTKVSGTVDVTSPEASGGTINVLGNQVDILGGTLHADGAIHGGTVHIGGTYRGQGTLPNALYTTVDADTLITANGYLGNGGTVILWADKSTTFFGNITAGAGLLPLSPTSDLQLSTSNLPLRGNGGFVEVSGKEHLRFRGSVDTSSVQGNRGTLLLDPDNITILPGDGDGDDVDTDTNLLSDGVTEGEVDPEGIIPTMIYESELEGLAAETNVSIIADNGITINPLSDGTLTFESNNGGGDITFTADDNDDGIGDFIMDSGDTISALSRNLEIQGANLSLGTLNTGENGGDITLISTGSNTTTGAIAGGTLTLTGENFTLGRTEIETLNLNSSNILTLNDDLIAVNGLDFSFGNEIVLGASDTVISSSGNLNFNDLSITGEALSLQGNNIILNGPLNLGSLTITQEGTLTLGSELTLTGPFIQDGTGPVELSENITTPNFPIIFSGDVELGEDITLSTTGGDIILEGTVNGSYLLGVDAGGGDVTLGQGGLAGLDLNNISTLTFTGNFETVDALDLSNLTTLAIPTATTLTAGGNLNLGSIDLSGQDLTLVSNEIILAGSGSLENLTVNNEGTTTLNLSNLSLSGNFNQTGGGNVTLTGDLNASGDIVFDDNLSLGGETTLNSSSGNITTTEITGTETLNVIAPEGTLDLGTVNSVDTLNMTADTLILTDNIAPQTPLDFANITTVAVASNIAIESPGTLDWSDTNFTSTGEDLFLTAETILLGDLTFNNNEVSLNATTITLGNTDVETLTLGNGDTLNLLGNLTVENNLDLTSMDVVNLVGEGNIVTSGNLSTSTVVSAGNGGLQGETLTLGTIDVAGNSDIIATEEITANQINVGGILTLEGGDITLEGDNSLNQVVITNATNVILNDGENSLLLGEVNLEENLNITAVGDISNTGNLVVGGITTLTGENITLTGSNDFNEVSLVAQAATLTDENDLILTETSSLENLTVEVGGTLTQTDSLTVEETTTLTGENITLTESNDFNEVSLAAQSATLTDENDLTLENVDLGGDFTLTTGGDINGTLNLGGTGTFDSNGNTITLETTGTSPLTFTNSNNVTLTHTGDLVFGGLTLTGNLEATATGEITSTGGLVVAGDASFTSSQAEAGNVTLFTTGDLNLGNSTVGGNLTLSAIGEVTNTASVSVAGITEVNTSELVTLDILGTVNLSNGDTIITQVGAIVLPGGTTDGNLVVNSLETGEQFSGTYDTLSAITLNQPGNNFGGTVTLTTATTESTAVSGIPTITQTGEQIVTGTAVFNVTPNGILSLDQNNQFNQVQLTAGEATLVNTTDLTLDNTEITGNFTLTNSGDIFNTGVVAVGGLATLTGNTIDLDQDNQFNQVQLTGEEATLVNTTDLTLDNTEITGNFTLTNSGDIFNTGVVAVGGITTLTGNTITLEQDNDFNIVTVLEAENLTLNDINSVDLGILDIEEDFTLTTQGEVTNSGNIQVGGITTLTGNTITLEQDNDFNIVTVLESENLTLNDINSVDLGTLDIEEDLTLTTQGEVTNSGNIQVGGITTLTGNTITLDQDNDFNIVTVLESENLTLQDITGVDLSTTTITNDLTVTAAGITGSGAISVGGDASFITTGDSAGNVQFTNTGDTVLDSSLIGGNFFLTSPGTLTQTPDSALQVAGSATFTAETIDLNNPNNVLPILNPPEKATVITQVGEIVLDDLLNNPINGDLIVNSLATSIAFTEVLDGGDGIVLTNEGNQFEGNVSFQTATSAFSEITGTPGITQNNPLTVNGTLILNATNQGDITLNSGGNDFNTIEVIGNNLVLNDQGSLILNDLHLSGDLSVISEQVSVASAGIIEVDGNATVEAETLFNSGTVNVEGDATVNVSTLTNNGEVNILGNFDLNATEEVNNENLLQVTGNATVETGTLSNSGTVEIIGNGTVETETLFNSGTVNVESDATVDVSTLTNNGEVNILGDFDLNATEEVNNENLLQVTGNATVETGTLSNSGTVGIIGNGTVETETLFNSGTVNVESDATMTVNTLTNNGEVNILGNFDLNATEEVNNENLLQVTGNATVNGGNLNNSGTITIENNLDFTTTGNILNTLEGLIAVGGDALVSTSGDIISEGIIEVEGTISLDSNGENIALTAIDNANLFITNAQDISFTDIENNDITITNAQEVNFIDSNDINLVASDITEGITIQSEQSIEQFSLELQGIEDITIISEAAIALDSSTIVGNLTVSAQGDITTDGAIEVQGNSLFNANGNDIVLDDTYDHNFESITITNGSNVTLYDTDSVALNTSQINGNLTLKAQENILDQGEVNVTGETLLTTTNGNIILDESNLQGLITLETLGESATVVTLLNGSDIDLASANTTGELTLESPGELTVNQGINAGDITLTAQENLTAAGTLNTSSNTTNGGHIAVTSLDGTINVEDIDTSGVNGGEVFLNALVSITAGEIETTGQINGGNVILDPIGDIEVASINAQGGTDGIGGKVDITAGQHFRATETFRDQNGTLVSISTLGENGSGDITIRHGGKGEVPFTIGTDRELLNGTEGAISTPEITLNNESLLYNSQRENIQILSGAEAPPIDDDPPSSRVEESPIIERLNSVDIVLPDSVEPIVLLSEAIVDTPQPLEDIEENLNQEFEQYFGWETTSGLTFHQAQELLGIVEETTHTRSAVVYALFVSDNSLGGHSLAPGTVTGSYDSTTNNESTEYLELLLIPPQGSPRLYKIPVDRQEVLKLAQEFRNHVQNYQRPQDYKQSAQQLYQWLIAPLDNELQSQGIENIIYIPANGLRTLPFAALHDGEKFVIEKYGISLMPSLSLTNTQLSNLNQKQVLAMGASNFTGTPTSAPLPSVPLELEVITNQYWLGQQRLNDEFVLTNLTEDSNNPQFGILHLATHADFRPGKPEDSYIRLWNEPLGLDQLDDIGLDDPSLELMILSACRTAFDDPNGGAGLGFAGLAHHIGVKSTIGSLWDVSDAGTLGLMTSFYHQLSQASIKVEALRQAQLALIRGEVRLQNGQLTIQQELVAQNGKFTLRKKAKGIQLPLILQEKGDQVFSHPYYWSAFTMIGNPW